MNDACAWCFGYMKSSNFKAWLGKSFGFILENIQQNHAHDTKGKLYIDYRSVRVDTNNFSLVLTLKIQFPFFVCAYLFSLVSIKIVLIHKMNLVCIRWKIQEIQKYISFRMKQWLKLNYLLLLHNIWICWLGNGSFNNSIQLVFSL